MESGRNGNQEVCKEIDMPEVGGTHYSYTKKGKRAAAKAARRTGQKVKNKKPKNKTRAY